MKNLEWATSGELGLTANQNVPNRVNIGSGLDNNRSGFVKLTDLIIKQEERKNKDGKK